MLRRLIAVLGLVLFCFVVAAPTFGSVTPYIPPGGSQPGLPGVDDPTYSFSFWGSGIAGGGFLNASGSPLAAGAGSLGTVTDPDETNQVITLVPGSGNWYPGTGGWQFTYDNEIFPNPPSQSSNLDTGGLFFYSSAGYYINIWEDGGTYYYLKDLPGVALDPNATVPLEGFTLNTVEAQVPEPATLLVWSLLGATSWLGMRVWRGGQRLGRRAWSPENRQAILDIVSRGRTC